MSFRIRSPSTRPDGPPLFVCNAAVPLEHPDDLKSDLAEALTNVTPALH